MFEQNRWSLMIQEVGKMSVGDHATHVRSDSVVVWALRLLCRLIAVENSAGERMM